MVECRLVAHGTPEYEATVALRFKVLREPLGLTFTHEQLAAEVSDLHCALWETGVPSPPNPLSPDKTPRRGEVLGCLILTPLSAGEIKMRQVAVQPDLQGQGLGRVLVEFSEETARAQGFQAMVLNARETAVPFYLRLSYELEGDPFTEVGIPHRKMRKRL